MKEQDENGKQFDSYIRIREAAIFWIIYRVNKE